ncbi:MAG: 50S ribosomal protein L11 methyltransferase [Pyrinomonadaceae bacterium]
MKDDNMVWQSLRLTVTEEAVEAIEFALNSLNALGTEIDYMRLPTSGVCVVGYFDRLPDEENVQDEIHYALRSYSLDENAILTIERSEVQNTDWLAEWKKHWKPTTVGRFVIAPPWEKVDEPERIVIRIEPNMAFGTGTHETTQLCLSAIDELYGPSDTFLDVGTGTGILAIAAALKSNLAKDNAIFAIDNDPDSVKIARENAQANGVGDRIEFRDSEITIDLPSFDFVCANLTLDVILPILPMLLAKANKFLVLSGILTEQENAVLRELEQCDVIGPEVNQDREWICVVVKNKGRQSTTFLNSNYP